MAICITETWLNDAISSAQTHMSGYQCIRSDRDSRRGGGCALYLHNSLVPSDELIVSDLNNNVAATYVESLHLILAVVFRPPDASDSCRELLMPILQMNGVQISI